MNNDLLNNIKANMPKSNLYLLNDIEDIQSTPGTEIEVDKLLPFPNHPFSVNTDTADFQELVESIKENGIISDIIVRPIGDKYEILSGHRRVAAAKILKMETVPAKVKELTELQATVIMVHSNLYRDKIAHSEKAKAYRMIRDAESHPGIKGGSTAELIGEKANESRANVYRYIKLSYLNDDLLNKVDNGEITLGAGNALADLDEESQTNVTKVIDNEKHKLSIEEARDLKDAYTVSQDSLDEEQIKTVLHVKEAEKPILPKEKKSISFKVEKLREYFGDVVDVYYMENKIYDLLEKYSRGEIS